MGPSTSSGETAAAVDPAGTGTMPTAPAVVTQPDPGAERASWLAAARALVAGPGRYLAFQDGDRLELVALAGEQTRIGRSLGAEVRFDDATVSRRHALVISGSEGVRVLDDRSLNGVFVNGQRVDSSPLADGDEVGIGRHAVLFLDVSAPA